MAHKAVVLLSGGIDSSTTLAIAKAEGHRLYALTVSYGQRHSIELKAAERVAEAVGVERHVVAEVDLRVFGGSALTDDMEVPKDRAESPVGSVIPPTYVPARNTILLSLALAWAEVLEAPHIYIGANEIDYSGYPDCRPQFIRAFEDLANLATRLAAEGRARFQIHAPLIHLAKADIVRKGRELGLDYSLTHSCYDPTSGGLACGRCDSCRLRLKGFREAGMEDPIRYATPPR